MPVMEQMENLRNFHGSPNAHAWASSICASLLVSDRMLSVGETMAQLFERRLALTRGLIFYQKHSLG